MDTQSLPNGDPTSLPLTAYSANPSQNDPPKTSASTSIPAQYLLPDGHPDVCSDTLMVNHCIVC